MPTTITGSDISTEEISGTLFVDSANGRIGVGTSSPDRPLHINGGAADTSVKITNDASGVGSTNGFEITVENPSSDVSFRNRESSNLKFFTDNSEAARIDSDGNLLIGTTVSAAPLTVDGTISSPNISLSATSGTRHVVNKKIESFDRANEKILLLIKNKGDAQGILSGTFIIGAASNSSSLNRVGCQTLFINAGAEGNAFDRVVISGFETAESNTTSGSFRNIDMKIVNLNYNGSTWMALYLPNRSTDSRRDTFADILFNGAYLASDSDSLTWVTESDVSSISTVLDKSNDWVNTRNGANRIGN